VDSLIGLQAELQHEPRVALLGEGFHERIAETAKARAIVLEVGGGQAAAVAAALIDSGWRDVAVTLDLAGIERVVEGLGA
jgi:methylase of polypeptide subunit release factors